MEKLISLGKLFKNSFHGYLERWRIFVMLWAISAAVVLAAIPFVIFFSFSVFSPYAYLSLISFMLMLFAIAAAIIACFLVHIAMTLVAREKNLRIGEYLSRAWQAAGSYLWVSLLAGLAVAGGFLLLIIPGIIFAVWFVCARYIVLFENIRGRAALARSRELAKGYWWAIAGRLLAVGVCSMLISWIPFVGPIINILFTTPFAIIYIYLIYEDLKRIHGQTAL